MIERRFDLTDPDSYRHWTLDKVRFADQDGNGHVNNNAIAVYVEGGRVAYNNEVLMPERRPGERFVIARVTVNYLAEAHYPGAVKVGTRVIRLGRSSFGLGSGVFKDGRCIATADTVIVFMTGPEPTPIPGAVRALMEGLLVD